MLEEFVAEIIRSQHARWAWVFSCTKEELIKTLDHTLSQKICVNSLCDKTGILDVSSVSQQMHTNAQICLVDLSYPGLFHAAPLVKGADMVVDDLSFYYQAIDMPAHACCVLALSKHISQEVYSEICACTDHIPRVVTTHECLAADFDWLAYTQAAQKLSDCAQVCACYLECHPCVSEIFYPGLTTNVYYPRASRVFMHGFGNVFAFTLQTDKAKKLLDVQDTQTDFSFSLACEKEKYCWLSCTCLHAQAYRFVDFFENL